MEEELKNKKIFEIKTIPEPEKIYYGIISLKNNILPSHINIFINELLK